MSKTQCVKVNDKRWWSLPDDDFGRGFSISMIYGMIIVTAFL